MRDLDIEKENLLNESRNEDVSPLSSTIHECHASLEVIKKEGFAAYSSKVSWPVFIMISIFTLGSWLDISGVWCELPVLVHELPEGWRLPGILSGLSQCAQIGPVMFMAMRWAFPKQCTLSRVNFVLLITGAISCILLAFTWKRTLFIFNEQRSISLYIFNFSLSLLDNTSTLTFLPYISQFFAKEYIIPNYIGESLSSLLPAIIAMVQGVGAETACMYSNVTVSMNGTTTTSPTTMPPTMSPLDTHFSVSVYFLLMFGLLVMSIIAFTLLHYSEVARRARRTHTDEQFLDLNCSKSSDMDSDDTLKSLMKQKDRIEVNLLLAIIFVTSFIIYGFMPGMLSYSTIPYGLKYLHLSINLSSIFMPLSVFLSIWSYEVSVRRICVETAAALLFSVYILVISSQSPCPALVHHVLGGWLIVTAWILNSFLFMRVRCIIATKLERHGQTVLYALGWSTISGQVVGGIIVYVVVDVMRLFTEGQKCNPYACT